MNFPKQHNMVVFNWVIQGMQFGYPPCCIGEFVQYGLASQNVLRQRGKRKFHGTGFVPCKDCNNKSVESLLARINEYRDPKLPKFNPRLYRKR